MLARTFLTAAELKLSEKKYDALILALHMLESGEVAYYDLENNHPKWATRNKGKPFAFNMVIWRSTPRRACGTVCCIGGLAESLGGVRFLRDDEKSCEKLYELFYIGPGFDLSVITVEQAVRALNNFLITGDPKWDDVLDG